MVEPTEDMGLVMVLGGGLRPWTARCDRLSRERVAGGRVWQQPRRSQLQVLLLLFSSFPFSSPSLFPLSPPSPSPLGGDGAEGAGIFFWLPY